MATPWKPLSVCLSVCVSRYLTAAWLQALLAEYLTNGDTLEASRCLMELNVPYYHHELVKRALVMAADDSKGHDSPLLLKLLSELASSGAINQAGHINAIGALGNLFGVFNPSLFSVIL